MRYKFPIKKVKNWYALEISCAKCKTPIAIYQKAGKGNLIKMQFHRIIEAQNDIKNIPGHLICHKCDNILGNRGKYKNKDTFWIVRGQINTQVLRNYKYKK
ncbi:MAG: hypothetical protein Q4P31_01205 [Andreesenia angusta]|nr:hypothetical protein [Andreesenia angusta]